MTILGSMEIGLQSLMAQTKRLEVYTKNIANVDTPNYQREIPVLTPSEELSFKAILANAKDNVFTAGATSDVPGGVSLSGVIHDPTPGEKQYLPGHPDADENGYVTSSNVNVLNEMADATMTTKTYEAIINAIGFSKQMATKAVDIGRG